MVCQAVYGGGQKRVKEEPPQSPTILGACFGHSEGSTLSETHVMRDKGARGGQSTGSHLEPQVGVNPMLTIVVNWPVLWNADAMRQC